MKRKRICIYEDSGKFNMEKKAVLDYFKKFAAKRYFCPKIIRFISILQLDPNGIF